MGALPVVELEERHTIATGTTPDINTVRTRRVKAGGGLNLEQQITPSLGLFAQHVHGTIWSL
jgi:hypothetical protein